MNNKLTTARVLVAVTLIFVVVGITGYGSSARSRPGSLSTSVLPIDDARSNPAMLMSDPEAIYEAARIVHNVTVNNQKGMRVHAKFRVKYGLGVPCMMIAYFFYDDTANTPLKTTDPKYRTKTGTVSSTANFTPAYDPAIYPDLEIFMPYAGLNMQRGKTYQLKFYLALYDKAGGRFFGKSGWYKFTLTMP